MSQHASTVDTEIRGDVESRTKSVSILPLTAGFDVARHDVRGYDISPSMMGQLEHGGDQSTFIGGTAVRESDMEYDMIGVGQ